MLEDELALLVLLVGFKGLVILPANRFLALPARDVADNMATRRHVALAGLARLDVDDAVEKVGLAVLAAEVLLVECWSAVLVQSRWKHTRLIMSSWLARWVLHVLQPYILPLVR